MRTFDSLLAALLLGGSAAAVAAGTDADTYLNDLLERDPAYRQVWTEMVSQEAGLPNWVLSLSGVSMPVASQRAGDETYEVAMLCKQHDCFNNRLYVAFSADKKQVDALYVSVPEGLADSEAPSSRARQRWLGGPGFEVRKLLEDQLSSDPNWR